MSESDPRPARAREPIAAPAGVPDHADIVALPALVYLGAMVAGLLTQGAIGGFISEHVVPRLVLGALALALGIFGTVLCSRRFEDKGEDAGPLTPTRSLIVDGPYAWSRNPFYVSLTFGYVGLALLIDNVWMLVYLVPLLVLMHYGVILREELYLERKFGEEYLEYKSKVRRWI